MHEIDQTKLTDQTKFRWYEIKNIENSFINKINQQKAYSKKLSRYVTIFDYIDNILNKTKKHDQLLMLAESEFNSIETLISQALGDLDISHKEFIMILKEKDKYEKVKCNLISENEDEKQ